MTEEEIIELLAGPWLNNTPENHMLVSLNADTMQSLCDYCTHLFFCACEVNCNNVCDILETAKIICNNFLILGLRGIIQREPLVCVYASICRPVIIDYGDWHYVLYFQNAPFPTVGCHAEV